MRTLAPSALLLDFDGTLVDSMGVLWDVYAEFLGARGARPTRAEFDALVGTTLPEIADRLRRAHGLPESATAVLEDYRRRLLRIYTTKCRPARGADSLLSAARASGLPLALVTSASAEIIRSYLAARGWSADFTAVVTADDVADGKPDPAPYRLALAYLGVLASTALAVEDAPHGVRAAVGAGVRTLGLAIPGSDEAVQLRAAGAAEIVGSLEEVVDLVVARH